MNIIFAIIRYYKKKQDKKSVTDGYNDHDSEEGLQKY